MRWPRRWPAWRGALVALHLVEFALDDEAGSLAALPAAGALHRRRPHGGQIPGAGHYAKIVTALHETMRLMGEIDAVIEEHGGWPGAFA